MSVYFLRRGEPPAIITTVAVTITGRGNFGSCYAIINGTKQYEAGTHEVNTGDTITFGVIGKRNSIGYVTIDGTQVLSVKSGSTETYDWTVPSGISAIEIAMKNASSSSVIVNGRITVTTA